jgi:hypothetical protein
MRWLIRAPIRERRSFISRREATGVCWEHMVFILRTLPTKNLLLIASETKAYPSLNLIMTEESNALKGTGTIRMYKDIP